MGRQYKEIRDTHRAFISEQKIFFVATALEEGRINLSPKGIDTLRVVDSNKVLWLNLTGSGNETATHVLHSGRMTIMFCAFDGPPNILRLYGQAQVFHPGDPQFKTYKAHFPEIPGTRQIFEMAVELVQSSCGMGVPLMEYLGNRKELIHWAKEKGNEGLRQYMEKKNTKSLDGLPTGIKFK